MIDPQAYHMEVLNSDPFICSIVDCKLKYTGDASSDMLSVFGNGINLNKLKS